MSRRNNQRAHPHVPSRRSPRLISRGDGSPTNPEELEQLDPQEQIGDQEPENTTQENTNQNQAGAPAFALAPAQANASNILDYSLQADVKIHNKASSELPQKFDCNSKNVPMFCEKLKDRAQESDRTSTTVQSVLATRPPTPARQQRSLVASGSGSSVCNRSRQRYPSDAPSRLEHKPNAFVE